jgi:UDP-N-acetylmuramoylalanine--D-glutamate ligase
MGLGRFGGGVDVAEFASLAGAKVIVTDLAPAEKLSGSIKKLSEFSDIEFHLGSHEPADFEQADIVVANPAVPDDNEFLELARRNNKVVTSQISIFFELCPAKIIGITGANGKSTTAALTVHLLENAVNEKVWLSGNIGNQPLLTALEKIKANDLVVLELSSFQLEQLAQIQKAPMIALLTNLTPNHLDRYGTFDRYCSAKENIFKFQNKGENLRAVSIFNAEDEISTEWFEKYKNDTGRLCIKFSTGDVSNEIRSIFPLPGRANLSNLAAAMAIARHFGVDDEQLKNCLPEFKALPHRLELVERINGVSWYNDSKATTPKSAIVALEAFEQPVIIIAGGYDKNLTFDEFGKTITEKAKIAILIGQTAPKIADAIWNARLSLRAKRSNPERVAATEQSEVDGPSTSLNSVAATHLELVDSFAEAVKLANKIAKPGDVVLLSPACASYDMFENFERRGNEFIRLVRSIHAER